jgi:hypothetical protein
VRDDKRTVDGEIKWLQIRFHIRGDMRSRLSDVGVRLKFEGIDKRLTWDCFE